MREPMSPQFIESFVETCMDSGLTKEATAELLQRRSAIHAAEQSPAFAEGYLAVKERLPASSQVRVRPGYVEKQAFGRLVGSGLDDAARFVGRQGQKLWGAAKRNPKTTGAILGGAGLTAGGIAGGTYLANRDRAPSPNVPFLPGGYNPKEEQKAYERDLHRNSEGIARNNQIIDGAGSRRQVLRKAVEGNTPQSAHALKELQKLDAEVGAATRTRDGLRQQLDSRGDVVASRLANVQDRQQTLRDRKQSPFWRGLHWATFRNPAKSYDKALNELQPGAAELSNQNALMNKQRARLPYYLGGNGQVHPPEQMQREFFPTY